MRCATLWVLIALLISGQAYANSITVNEGDSYQFFVTTLAHPTIEKCHLVTPQGNTINFIPNDQTQSTDKFVIENGNIVAQCQVTVRNFEENDNGDWVLYYTHPEGTGNSEIYTVTVIVKDEPTENHETTTETSTELTTEPTTESTMESVKLLSEIRHLTRMNTLIDISLNKDSFEEECYIITPSGAIITDANTVEGLTIQRPSEFVSCRITIGPMNEELLGTWKLCGRSKEGEQQCQPANISWNNNSPNSQWAVNTHQVFNHMVHYGGAINPGVLGTGEILTCHVITPNGEDLVLTSDAHYPTLEQVSLTNPSLCSVVIKVVDKTSLGNWTVYGKFRSVLGLNEVRIPMTLSLYNEQDPFEQAYNVTLLSNVNRIVNLGNTIEVAVTGESVIDRCEVTTPLGHKIYQNGPEHLNGVSFGDVNAACHITLSPITEEMLGDWKLVGKFNDGVRFTERVQSFSIIKEDPFNPIEDNNRVVLELDAQIIETSMGTLHQMTIPSDIFTNSESCHLRTPNGAQYKIMEGFNVPGVEVIQQVGVECGVTINLITEDLVGEWVLIARAIRFSEAIERRLPVTIYVEEQVNAVPNHVNMAEGTDLYIRLEQPTDLYQTCRLIGPNDDILYEVDTPHASSCGYIVRNVSEDQSGEWKIVYGNIIVYKAVIAVNIFARSTVKVEDQIWTLGRSVEMAIGPEDAVYCKLEDPSGFTVFEGFDRCSINIARVTTEHDGKWTMSVGMPGTVLLKHVEFKVDVNEEANAVVTTNVVRVAPSVMLTCSVPSQYEVRGCKFRDHHGNIMIVHQGVGQNSDNADATGYQSEMSNNSCTLRLTNPTTADIGVWRCAVDTTEDTLYAFLTVTCPWLMQTADDAVSLEPVLIQARNNIVSLEGEPTTMSCTITASIRYCYFRARNGSIFNVRPGHSSQGFEYVGAGFHAGDCGIRFNSLLATDSGRWSCHVGLLEPNAPEQNQQIEVLVQEKMTVSHYRHSNGDLVLEGAVYNYHRLEYCRFIRIDGLGFTSDNVPEGYSVDNTLMDNGYCTLFIAENTILNQHPWTVVAKLAGVDQEIAKSSVDHLMAVDNPGNTPGGSGSNNRSMMYLLWVSCALSIMIVSILGVALGPKKNREWTQNKASQIRNSFRKKPLLSRDDTVSTKERV